MKETSLYDKNLKLLKEKCFSIYKKIIKEDAKEANIEIKEIVTNQGICIPEVELENGRKLALKGVFGEKERVEEMFEAWGKMGQHMPFFFYGITNFEVMKAVYKKLGEESIIILYEPSIKIFKYYMSKIDFEEILSDWPIQMEVGEYEEEKFESVIGSIIHVDTVSQLKIIIAPNYNEIFLENLSKTVKLVKKKFGDFMVNIATAELYTDVVGENMLYNIYHMFHGYSVEQLRGVLKHKVPVFLVSAGPSLNKNIKELKAAEGKACIIAVDTAIKPLLNHGIKPDFFVIVDGKKPTDLMAHPDVSDVPIVACTIVARGIMDLHKGKKFFYYDGIEVENTMWMNCIKDAVHKEAAECIGLPTGGSVANTAFSLARLMEAKEIILVGQDLALKNDVTHADGTFKEKMDKASDDMLANGLWVEGIRGNMVKTLPDFARYLRWFEEMIKYYKLKNVTDATQGGAKIHGAKLMTLKKAIEKYCVEEFRMQEIVDELPEMFDYEAKCKFVEQYINLPKDMQRVSTNANKAVKLYKKMLELAEEEELNVKELNKLFKEITKLNEFMNTDKCALFVQETMMQVNFTLRMGIYQEEEDEKEDVKVMAQHGIAMNRYINASARYWKKQAQEIVEKRKLEVSEADVYYPIDWLVKQLKERESGL